MALSISQIVAVSYPALLGEKNKAQNQFAENGLLREMERQGAIVNKDFGPTLEEQLDYQRNPGTDFLANEGTTHSMAKTEVLTAASYDPADIGVPIVITLRDEAKNPSENQKIALAKALMENAMVSHDDAIEEALFSTTTDGFIGAQTLIPDDGQGSPGGIPAATELWWRNYTADYNSDGTDLDTELTTAWNTTAKGTGSNMAPSLIWSGPAAQALYESTLQANQRFIDSDEAKSGFKVIAFKTARWVFSQYGGTRIYGGNPKAFKLNFAKGFRRMKTEPQIVQNGYANVQKVYSALQTTTGNKSRLFVITQA